MLADMAFEIERKYRVDDVATFIGRLEGQGVHLGPEVPQADHYYAHPARDFAATGEAFRIRVDGDRACLTYKGPKLGGPAKTREEIEVPFDGGHVGAMAALLDRLGFAAVAVVGKARRSATLVRGGRELSVAVDRLDELGTFAEVEAIAADEPGIAGAQASVVAAAVALGLVDLEPRSYLRMVLEARGDL